MFFLILNVIARWINPEPQHLPQLEMASRFFGEKAWTLKKNALELYQKTGAKSKARHEIEFAESFSKKEQGLCLGMCVFWGIDRLEEKNNFYKLSTLLKKVEQMKVPNSFSLSERQFLESAFQKIIAAHSTFCTISRAWQFGYNFDEQGCLIQKELNEDQVHLFHQLKATLSPLSDTATTCISQLDLLQGMLREDYTVNTLDQIQLVKMGDFWFPGKENFLIIENEQWRIWKEEERLQPLEMRRSSLSPDYDFYDKKITVHDIFERFQECIYNVFDKQPEKKIIVLIGIHESEENFSGNGVKPNHMVALTKDDSENFVFFDPNKEQVWKHKRLDSLLRKHIKPCFEEKGGMPRAVYSIMELYKN